MKAIILIVCLLGSAAFGRDAEQGDQPVEKLPARIAAPAGVLSLAADFATSKPGEAIEVFLVNNTDKDVVLTHQDGNLYLKLETMTEGGEWVRAQSHAYSWCGNSYGMVTVRKGHRKGLGPPLYALTDEAGSTLSASEVAKFFLEDIVPWPPSGRRETTVLYV
jgi:hypothetical protein